MKQQILHDLFNGQIYPGEKKPEADSECARQSSVVADKAAALRTMLTGEHLAVFNDYTAEHYYLTHLYEEDGFVKGFSLALKVLIAALDLPDDDTETTEDLPDDNSAN